MSPQKTLRGIVLGVIETLLIGAVMLIIITMPDVPVLAKGTSVVLLALVDVVCWASVFLDGQ